MSTRLRGFQRSECASFIASKLWARDIGQITPIEDADVWRVNVQHRTIIWQVSLRNWMRDHGYRLYYMDGDVEREDAPTMRNITVCGDYSYVTGTFETVQQAFIAKIKSSDGLIMKFAWLDKYKDANGVPTIYYDYEVPVGAAGLHYPVKANSNYIYIAYVNITDSYYQTGNWNILVLDQELNRVDSKVLIPDHYVYQGNTFSTNIQAYYGWLALHDWCVSDIAFTYVNPIAETVTQYPYENCWEARALIFLDATSLAETGRTTWLSLWNTIFSNNTYNYWLQPWDYTMAGFGNAVVYPKFNYFLSQDDGPPTVYFIDQNLVYIPQVIRDIYPRVYGRGYIHWINYVIKPGNDIQLQETVLVTGGNQHSASGYENDYGIWRNVPVSKAIGYAIDLTVTQIAPDTWDIHEDIVAQVSGHYHFATKLNIPSDWNMEPWYSYSSCILCVNLDRVFFTNGTPVYIIQPGETPLLPFYVSFDEVDGMQFVACR